MTGLVRGETVRAPGWLPALDSTVRIVGGLPLGRLDLLGVIGRVVARRGFGKVMIETADKGRITLEAKYLHHD